MKPQALLTSVVLIASVVARVLGGIRVAQQGLPSAGSGPGAGPAAIERGAALARGIDQQPIPSNNALSTTVLRRVSLTCLPFCFSTLDKEFACRNR